MLKGFIHRNGFLLGLVLAVAAAWLWPEVASDEGLVGAAWIRSAGVFAIFFLQGLGLSVQALFRGIFDSRLHICSQLSIFVLSPLLMLLLLTLGASVITDPALRTGFIYLAVLPTTVATAAALTSLSGGNVIGALFNATLSNVAGVFLVPLVVFAFLIEGNGTSPSFAQGLSGVVQLILVPLFCGVFLRRWFGDWALRRRIALRRATSGIILFLVYAAFCQSFLDAVWAEVSGGELTAALAGTALFLGILSCGAWSLGRAFRLPPDSQVSALFCGSQKTLVAGLPMAVSLFGASGAGSSELSLILIPLLCYHTLQLLLAGWLVPRLDTWRRREVAS